MKIRDYLKDHILLFDGGMGTCYAERSHQVGMNCELASLRQPELITQIHRDFLKAGCKAIKTNSFAANRMTFQGDETLVQKTIKAAWDLAETAAAEYDAFVFADIGPITISDAEEDIFEEYRFVTDLFLEYGAQNFLFETNASAEGLPQIAGYLKKKNPDAFIIVSFAVQADGFTRSGNHIGDLFDEMRRCPDVDSLGLNCICGTHHMLELIRGIDHAGICLSLMPNAGYPIVISNRTLYESDPVYYASQIRKMVAEGAAITGGCCGATPAYIEKIKEALSDPVGQKSRRTSPRGKQPAHEQVESRFWNKLQNGEKVIAVELDSPADASLDKFMKGARRLYEAGTDIITIADCPIARAHMDSSLLACKLQRELGKEALPHMTCRDRNLNASKALLLGLHAEGIRNILLVTGDPIPTAERDEVKSVYQFNSRKLASFVTSLGKTTLSSPFHLFGALNVNARNFESQLRFAREKQEKGIVGFLTQPILTPQAFENLKRARSELKNSYILGGVIPVVSARNARFMDSEISGIRVDARITELYEGKDREESEQLAVTISKEIMHKIEPFTDGYYLMTPFGRAELIAKIIRE